ncbi:MAG TPA: hypothetical protein VMF31_07740 [Solirubrobacterales bacterium]|nr:hypothetical protein [Solirubrobacterales bacterium]
MRLRTKIGSFVAAVFVVGAIGTAPANAASAPGFKVPSAESLGALCKSVKQPSLQTACNQGVAIIQTCSSQKGISAQLKCLSEAAKKFKASNVKLPSDLSSLLSKYGGSFGGLSLGNLLKGFDISKLLAGLKG